MVSLASLSFLTLPGCAGIGVSMVNQGAGSAASSAINHTFGGTTFRTYTLPALPVEQATLAALEAMGVAVDSRRDDGDNRVIVGTARHRKIEVVIEPVTERTTQTAVTVIEGIGIFRDSATATEIVLQTEKRIGEATETANVP